MLFLIRFWSSLTKKDSVESAKYEITKFSTCTNSFRAFFFMDPDPDFSGSDPDFRSIRIRTQEKISIRILKITLIRNTGYKRIWYTVERKWDSNIEKATAHQLRCNIIIENVMERKWDSNLEKDVRENVTKTWDNFGDWILKLCREWTTIKNKIKINCKKL